MGSLCSKGMSTSRGRRLGDPTPNTITYHHTTQPAPAHLPSASANVANPIPDHRSAAAEAAERRLKAAQARGTNTSNPKHGQLAAQLEANKSSKRQPEAKQEEQLVWD